MGGAPPGGGPDEGPACGGTLDRGGRIICGGHDGEPLGGVPPGGALDGGGAAGRLLRGAMAMALGWSPGALGDHGSCTPGIAPGGSVPRADGPGTPGIIPGGIVPG